MTSASITKDPVQNVEVLSTDTGFVGYLTFNDHIYWKQSWLTY